MAKRLQKSQKPLCFSKTIAKDEEAFEPDDPWSSAPSGDATGRPLRVGRGPTDLIIKRPERLSESEARPPSAAARLRLQPLIAEWLLELRVMGRSQRAIDWYQQKMAWYLEHEGGPQTLDRLTAFELKRLLASLQERELSANTIHGFFQVLGSFANCADREGYPVDPTFLKVRPPKVPQQEMETYSDAQLAAIFPGCAIRLVAACNPDPLRDRDANLGAGGAYRGGCRRRRRDRVLEDKEGKGEKFSRVPVSSRLRQRIILTPIPVEKHHLETEEDHDSDTPFVARIRTERRDLTLAATMLVGGLLARGQAGA